MCNCIMQPCQNSKCWERDQQQLKTAQDIDIKNADKLTQIINAILDNANGYPEDTVYNIACIVGLEVG